MEPLLLQMMMLVLTKRVMKAMKNQQQQMQLLKLQVAACRSFCGPGMLANRTAWHLLLLLPSQQHNRGLETPQMLLVLVGSKRRLQTGTAAGRGAEWLGGWS
jgi:hypothetical protein